MSEPFLVVEDLWKSYRSGEETISVLTGLHLEVHRGELIAVTGESGSGKSTLLHLLGAMERPDRGLLRIGGRELDALDEAELADFRNRTIGFVFQFHHLLPEFSAVENVMFPLLLRRVPFGEARRKAEEKLAEVGLAHRAHHQPGELSGGEQQRLALARALVGDPELLLADEPTGNLDPKTSQRIHELLVEIHRRHGLTSVLVTHSSVLAACCHRRFVLRDGTLEAGD
ncbi:MAG: ABC transporter ATP-binding protein [Acidobacteriota bacterium]